MIGSNSLIGDSVTSAWEGVKSGANWLYEQGVKFLPGIKGTVEAGRVLMGGEGGSVYIETGTGQQKLYSTGSGKSAGAASGSPSIGSIIGQSEIFGVPLKTIALLALIIPAVAWFAKNKGPDPLSGPAGKKRKRGK